MNNTSLFSVLIRPAVIILAALLAGCQLQEKEESVQSYIEFVDPFIGTGAHGHTYPGASVPFGMVQVSPDNGRSGWDWCSGYHSSDSIIAGFSHLHLSGTGIGDLADILLMPVNREVDLTFEAAGPTDYPFRSAFSHDREQASPGLYEVHLPDNQVDVALTASSRTGFQKYTFDFGAPPSVVLDLGFAINWDRAVNTRIEVVNDTLVTGYRMSKGWAKDQRVYFAMAFSAPIDRWTLGRSGSLEGEIAVLESQGARAQFFFNDLDANTLKVKTGISSAGVEGALANMGQDIPHWDFDAVVEEAQRMWNEELGKVQIACDRDELKTIFYTALYHAFLAPVVHSDVDGKYKGADGEIHRASYDYYSTFSLWDTFRAAHPLYTLLQGDRINDFVRSMLAHYEEYGYLPVWALAGNETNTMTGYHAVPVIADAWLKGYRDYDVELAYRAMKTSAMQNIRGVRHYKEYGYIPCDLENESVTKNLEYAFDDWCIAQIALALEETDDYNYFMERAASYRHLFDEKTGFMRGKDADGKWRQPFDPKYSSHMVNTDYTEGNAWQHSWFVPHDVSGLINLHGGASPFIQKLDSLFEEDSEIRGENASADISGLIGQYAHGNEPSHHIAYLYNYAGQPWKTQERVREIMETQYTAQRDGLCGNEDCGQMSAWYVFSAMGFYPVNPAEGIYVIGSPLVSKATIDVGKRKKFEVIAENASRENMYIQEAKLNGQPLERTFITHKEIMDGGKLELMMGNIPYKGWGRDAGTYPPSMSDRKDTVAQ
jgi:predicted alpha-1,2-mannosidase